MGKENLAADALSRRGGENTSNVEETTDATLHALSLVNYDWIAEVKRVWFSDPSTQAIIQDLVGDLTSHRDYVWQNQLLTYKGKIVVGDCSILKQKTI